MNPVVRVLLKFVILFLCFFSLVRISEVLYANFSSTCVRCTHLLNSWFDRWSQRLFYHLYLICQQPNVQFRLSRFRWILGEEQSASGLVTWVTLRLIIGCCFRRDLSERKGCRAFLVHKAQRLVTRGGHFTGKSAIWRGIVTSQLYFGS